VNCPTLISLITSAQTLVVTSGSLS